MTLESLENQVPGQEYLVFCLRISPFLKRVSVCQNLHSLEPGCSPERGGLLDTITNGFRKRYLSLFKSNPSHKVSDSSTKSKDPNCQLFEIVSTSIGT